MKQYITRTEKFYNATSSKYLASKF